jgi:hypothetical protein
MIMRKFLLILTLAAVCGPLFTSQASAAQCSKNKGHHHHGHHHGKHHKK